MVDIVLGSPDHRAGRDPLPAAGALGAVLPEEVLPTEDFIVLDETFLPERLGTDSAGQTLGVPGLVNNLQDEPVQYHPSAGATLRYGGCNYGKLLRDQSLLYQVLQKMLLLLNLK